LFIIVPVVSWSVMFYDFEFSTDSNKWADFGTFIGGTISPILAFVSFGAILITIKLQQDKNEYEKALIDSQAYCDNAIICLKRSFNFLSGDGTSSYQIKDRLVWLTSARLILQAEKLGSLISPNAISSIALYESEKDYWRHKFYNLIDYTGMKSFSMSNDYFAKASSIPGDEIDERSIKVIYQFALAFDSENDPIDKVTFYTTDELNDFHVSQRGLKQYLEKKISRREART